MIDIELQPTVTAVQIGSAVILQIYEHGARHSIELTAAQALAASQSLMLAALGAERAGGVL